MDISLLYKLCYHGLSPDEEQEVRQWADKDARRQVYIDRFIKRNKGEIYDLSDQRVGCYRADFLRNISHRRHRRTRYRLWTAASGAIAATVLVVLSFYGLRHTSLLPVKEPNAMVLLECDDCSEDLKQAKSSTRDITMESAGEGWKKIAVGRGAEYEMELDDGTHIWLNSDSRLYFPEHFEADERRVMLEGEAYFSVTKDAAHPFIVQARGVNIKVYGTEFNVVARQENSVRTTLVSGSVAVKFENEQQETVLTPGLTAEVNASTHQLNISQCNTEVHAGWKDGKFCFEDTPLNVLFAELALWYDLQVDFETPQAGEECFTGSLSRNMALVDLLRVLQSTTYVSFRLKGRHLTVGKLQE